MSTLSATLRLSRPIVDTPNTKSIDLSARKRLGKLVYASVFLLGSNTCFEWVLAAYDDHLIHTDQMNAFRIWHQYWNLTSSLFFLAQMIAVLIFCQPIRNVLGTGTSGNAPRRSAAVNVALGFVVGLAAFVLSFWTLLAGRQPLTIAVFFANHFYSVSAWIFIAVLTFALPVASEMFFRGVFLAQLLDSMPVVPALLLSIIVFAWTWPLFNSVPGLALGLVSSILFYRTRSVLACVVANATATVAIGTYLTYHALM
jgi:membrane protease YdiL (CAAX protease family)